LTFLNLQLFLRRVRSRLWQNVNFWKANKVTKTIRRVKYGNLAFFSTWIWWRNKKNWNAGKNPQILQQGRQACRSRCEIEFHKLPSFQFPPIHLKIGKIVTKGDMKWLLHKDRINGITIEVGRFSPFGSKGSEAPWGLPMNGGGDEW